MVQNNFKNPTSEWRHVFRSPRTPNTQIRQISLSRNRVGNWKVYYFSPNSPSVNRNDLCI